MFENASTLPHYSLPISKLRGVPQIVRVRLKSRRITNCGQLLDAAGENESRQRLLKTTLIEPATLLALVQRADMSRVNGIGAVFGMMLEDLGVRDVQTLGVQPAAELHTSLRDYNQVERLARRSPTPDEVQDWVDQAGRLQTLVTYSPEEEVEARRPSTSVMS